MPIGTSFRNHTTRCIALAAIFVLLGSADRAAARPALMWTQPDATPEWRFNSLIDGVWTTLSAVSCGHSRTRSECFALLPPLAPGPHTIALAAVDAFGNESPPSELLAFTVDPLPPDASAPIGHGLSPASSSASGDAGPGIAAIPSRTCVGQDCYGVSLLAHGQGAVNRLEPISDGGVLMLRDGSEVLSLRSGHVATAYQLRRDDPTSSAIADIASDPDFARNRFVYLAVVTTSAESSRVRLVRAREVGDTLAEPATIVPDLPIGRDVMPRLAVTPDRRIYLAIPSATDGSPRQMYDGLILAFMEDGRSAGKLASPMFARGPDQPSTLEPGGGLIWIGASGGIGDGLQLLRLSADAALAITRAAGGGQVGVLDLAFIRPDRGLLIAASPQALYEFALSPDAAVLVSERIDLGALEPTAVTVTPSGEIVVAARDAANADSVLLLSLRSTTEATPR